MATSRKRELIGLLVHLAGLAILLFAVVLNSRNGWLIFVNIALLIATGIRIILKFRQQRNPL